MEPDTRGLKNTLLWKKFADLINLIINQIKI